MITSPARFFFSPRVVGIIATAAVAFPSLRYASDQTLMFSHQSSRMVAIELMLPSNRALRISEADDAMATVRFDGGPTFGITPHISRDMKSVAVSVSRTDDSRPSTGLSIMTTVGEAVFDSSSYQFVHVHGFGIPMRIVGVTATAGADAFEAAHKRSVSVGGQRFGDTCCVACDGMQTCACAVDADCASCCAGSCCGFLEGNGPGPGSGPGRDASSIFDLTAMDIDGGIVSLSQYRGKALLIVNTAGRPGLARQYEALERIYSKYHSDGFVVLAFPAESPGGREPSSNERIKTLYTAKYKVSFPIFSKISVGGPNIHRLYQYLTDKRTDPEFGGRIRSSFTKFLIAKDGKIVGRFEPNQEPDSKEVVSAIEKALH